MLAVNRAFHAFPLQGFIAYQIALPCPPSAFHCCPGRGSNTARSASPPWRYRALTPHGQAAKHRKQATAATYNVYGFPDLFSAHAG